MRTGSLCNIGVAFRNGLNERVQRGLDLSTEAAYFQDFEYFVDELGRRARHSLGKLASGRLTGEEHVASEVNGRGRADAGNVRNAQGPLSGLLVVDTTWGMPGSIAGMLLADYGARVVKLERPDEQPDGAPVLRAVVERGKWSIVLDPADEGNAPTIDALLSRADVLLDSGPAVPGGWRAPATVGQRHPHLVHCLISAYGVDGPFVGRPGWDALVAARFGMMVEQPGHREGPVWLGHPGIDYVTAFMAAIGVLSALRARTASGRGQLVDTSLMDGALSILAMNWWFNEHDLSYLARDGDEQGFGKNRLITDLFECADGEYLMIHTGGDGGFKRTMDLLGFGDVVRDVGGLEMSVPLNDDEYHAARHLVPEALHSRNRDEWIKLFHAADLAALPVLRPEEIFHDDQVVHAGVSVDLEDPVAGTLRQVGPVVRFRRSPAPPTSPAPVRGANDDRLDDLLALPLQEGGQVRSSLTAPLQGLRVVDFSAFFATAFGARLLSDLGADVIKVEPLRGDQMRPLADLFEGAQRGKRNLAIDLRTPEGAEVVSRLVATADVVMHNLRPGKAEKLGIGHDQCVALNPSLVYCYLPGFGSTGPKSKLKSFAPLVSGFTGMLYIGAGEGNPPVRRVLGNEDLYNGYLGALSVLMGLIHRDRTGEGQYIESPHLHSSLLFRTEECADPQSGQRVTGLQLDAEQTGWGPLYRLYRTADGWIALACVGQRAFERLTGALRRPDLLTDPRFATESGRRADGDALASELVDTFAALTSAAAFAALDGAGVACEIPAAAPYMPDFLWDQWAQQTGRVFEHQHPEHGYVREVGHCVRLSATPLVYKGTSARLGQHTRELLGELGYSPEEVGTLLQAVCREPV
jgi:crotonobetainyl-CoA:carnitine CoA-transferase CaiB-like acyl-CoA transferase